MTASALHVAGTGTFAAEVIEFARAAGYAVEGLVEPIDPDRIGTEHHGFRVGAFAPAPRSGSTAVVGVGRGRAAIGARLASAGWRVATIVHPTAVVSPSARLGAGVVIGPLVVVGAQSEIADHALLGRGVLVGHHTRLGEGVTLNPGANVAGMVTIGREATVGMAAAIADGTTVGASAVVAAGAVVLRDVGPGVRVQGVPARPYRKASP